MKIVYHCYGGTHSSVVAASIHAGILPHDRVATGKELLSLPLFDTVPTESIGQCYMVGHDEDNSEIFAMGMGSASDIVKRAIISVLGLYGLPADDILFVNALPQIGLLVRFGGMLSRRLGLPRIGRPLVIRGIQRCYGGLLGLVEDVRRRVMALRRV